MASVFLAGLSVWAALDESSQLGAPDHKTLGKFIVAFWAIVPPVFFWWDWVHFCRDMKPDAPERDVAKHTHDLARNIWLGVVAVLTFAFFKSFGLGGD
jgi:hypothetical protein